MRKGRDTMKAFTMKAFTMPEIKVALFEAEEILTTSGDCAGYVPNDNEGYNDWGT